MLNIPVYLGVNIPLPPKPPGKCATEISANFKGGNDSLKFEKPCYKGHHLKTELNVKTGIHLHLCFILISVCKNQLNRFSCSLRD